VYVFTTVAEQAAERLQPFAAVAKDEG